LPDYREHVLETIYAGASIDYAPVHRSWFVLSDTRDDTVFYEPVSFTCDGRRITSLAMLYPHAQCHYYNSILEKIARTFAPAARLRQAAEHPARH
jgi:alpha/beta superfamily hydrolase